MGTNVHLYIIYNIYKNFCLRNHSHYIYITYVFIVYICIGYYNTQKRNENYSSDTNASRKYGIKSFHTKLHFRENEF